MLSIKRSVVGLLAFAFALGIGSAAVRADDPVLPGVSFNGGDGSYKRAVADGFTLGISNDPPYTYRDEMTQKYDGIDVRIFQEDRQASRHRQGELGNRAIRRADPRSRGEALGRRGRQSA